MNWRIFIIIPFWVLFFAGVGHYLPRYLEWQPELPLPQFPREGYENGQMNTLVDRNQMEKHRPAITEAELVSMLEQKLKPAKTMSTKGTPQMIFGSGVPLYTLYEEAQDILHDQNCVISDGLELKSHQLLQFDYTCASIWSSRIRFEIKEKFTTDLAKLALIFVLDSALSIEELQLLSKSNFPYTLMINPFDMAPSLPHDINKLTNREIIHSLPMEPAKYPYLNPGPETLLIHYKKDQVQKIIAKADSLLPKAVAVAPLYGDRAIGHRPLMEFVLQELKNRNQLFVANQSHDNNVVRQLCLTLNTKCTITRWPVQKPEFSTSLRRAVANSKKIGQNMLLLTLNKEMLTQMNELTQNLDETGVELVLLSEIKDMESME